MIAIGLLCAMFAVAMLVFGVHIASLPASSAWRCASALLTASLRPADRGLRQDAGSGARHRRCSRS
jgi:hypothetical protein